MKVLLLLTFLAISFTASADTQVEASKGELQLLDQVIGVHSTYSKTSELEAKVVEMLAGDGMNPTRMVLVLNTGYHDSKVYALDVMMYQVKRIVFLAKDKIVINYIQDTFGDLGDMDDLNDMTPVQVNKSITIEVLRNSNGSLADQIKILE